MRYFNPNNEESGNENPDQKRLLFSKLQSTPTLQKSLKYVTKIQRTDNPILFRFFSHSWKLHTFKFSFYGISFPFKQFMKRFINHKLENFTLHYWQPDLTKQIYTNKYMLESLQHFTSLKEAVLQFPNGNEGQILPQKSHRFKRLEKLTLEEDSSLSFMLKQNMKKFATLLELVLPEIRWGEYQDFLVELTSIPNLRHLSLHFRGNQNIRGEDNLSFLVKFEKLQSLTLFLERVKTYSLKYLLHMKNMKELCFKEVGAKLDKGQERRKFPMLLNLTKLTIFLRNTQFCFKSIRETLKENRSLKELNLDCTLPEIVELFQENLILPLEMLSLQVTKSVCSFSEFTEDFVDLIQRHDKLRRFSFKTQLSEANLIPNVLKALQSFSQLEELEVIIPQVGQYLERDKIGKDYSFRLFDLKKMVFDMKKITIPPSEIDNMISTFSKFTQLKKVIYEANFDKISSKSFEKFIKMMRYLRAQHNAEIIIYGYTHTTSSEANKIFNTKYSLWPIKYVIE